MKNMKYKWINYLLALIIILPILVLIIWSFTARWPWPELFPENFTMRGINELWKRNQNFTQIILSSVGLSLTVALVSVLIGLCTSRAYISLRSKTSKGALYALVSLPFLVPAIVFAMGIHQIMIRLGIANTYFGVILSHVIYSLPYATYLILDAYQAIGFNFEEEAMILGASESQAFFQVTLPLLLPVMSTSFAMSYVVSFSQYFISLLLGGGQVRTFAIVMYPYLQNNDRTIASNYAMLFLIITLLVFFIFERLSNYLQKKYQTSSYY